LFSSSIQLVQAESSVGCGLGQMIAPKQSLISATTRYITNGTFCNQIFGMSSGTSGCTQHSIVKKESASQFYAEANLENLKVEMAQGGGEYLVAFADALGCNDQAKNIFTHVTQKEYGKIFQNGNESANQMLDNVKKVVNENQGLKGQCQNALI
jgi:hypothetical protein